MGIIHILHIKNLKAISRELVLILRDTNNFLLSGGLNTFKTESYEQLNDVRFEGFNLNNPSSNELVQIHTPAKDLL